MTRDDLIEALQHDNVQAFLRVIRAGETSQDDDAYRMMFGGDLFDVAEGWHHPRRGNTYMLGGKPITSTAAGAFQFLARTWDEMQKQYGLADFSPVNQDMAAVGLIARRRALDDVKEGRIHEAIRKCAKEWASLPGSPYGQPTRSEAEALAVYQAHGGGTAAPAAVPTPQPTTTEAKPMAAPLLLSLIPSLVGLIPKLAPLFSSGSEVAQRNVAAASIVADAVVKATESPNLQAAIETMQQDPEALKAAAAAIDEVWPMLTESGGGGIAEARKAAGSFDQLPPWRNPSVWVTLLFVPLIYAAAYAVLFREGFTDDLKAMVVTAIFAGLLGSITGFFLGSSLGSHRKTEKGIP